MKDSELMEKIRYPNFHDKTTFKGEESEPTKNLFRPKYGKFKTQTSSRYIFEVFVGIVVSVHLSDRLYWLSSRNLQVKMLLDHKLTFE